MATALAPGDILRATFWSTNNTQASATTIYSVFNAVTGGVPTDATYAISADAAFGGTFRAFQSSQSTYRGVIGQKIWPLPIYLGQPNNGSTGAGTVGVTSLPRQTRGIVHLGTKFAGRSFRGRVYMPFPSQNYNGTFGEVNAGGITLLTAMANAIVAFTTINDGGGNTGTIIPVLYHRKLHTYTSIEASVTVAGTKWATQRRSGDYGRPNTSPV